MADLTTRYGVTSVIEAMTSGAGAGDALDIDAPQGECALRMPVPDARRIFCIGVNYMNRNEEYKDGQAAPDNPSIFVRGAQSFTHPDSPLIRPPESAQLDYEGEIVILIGRKGRRIAEADAHALIGGLALMNEGTIRDWVRHGKFNVTQGKNWDRSGSIGPWVTTNVGDFDFTDMTVETRVNDEVRQSDSTASMAFPFAKIIAYLSTFTELGPGDVIATGTPTGAGARLDPPQWLKPGDMVKVTSPGLGTLYNSIADERI
ncbi:MAG: fumarylacetoacetate hydrolase family protein [Pseudomonadota bacterium]